MADEEKDYEGLAKIATAAAIALGAFYLTTITKAYVPKAYNHIKYECCKVFSNIQDSYIKGLK